jgi:hypothetical protein
MNATGMRCNLLVWNADSDAPSVYELPENVWVRLGRGRDVDIEVSGDRLWSREQVDLRWNGKECHIHLVANALAELFRDDEPCVEAWMKSGDTVRVGRTVLEVKVGCWCGESDRG